MSGAGQQVLMPVSSLLLSCGARCWRFLSTCLHLPQRIAWPRWQAPIVPQLTSLRIKEDHASTYEICMLHQKCNGSQDTMQQTSGRAYVPDPESTAATCIARVRCCMFAHCWARAAGECRRHRRQVQRLLLAGAAAVVLCRVVVDGVHGRICGSCHGAVEAVTLLVPMVDPIPPAAVGSGEPGQPVTMVQASAMAACCRSMGAVDADGMRACAPGRQLPCDVRAHR